ncbi:MAG: DUF5110 domain-containing protein [Tindallia sp. MSAO_Bac2]|nr:MAG: DUF5110 domain-containing protein [Tindallia sp. MSAO_Bac2]
MKSYLLNPHAQLFRFGNPIETESLSYSRDRLELQIEASLPLFEVDCKTDETVLRYKMNKGDRVLGLGEAMGGADKRGRYIEAYATDDPVHTPDKSALYGAHNYLFISGHSHCGIYLDFPGRISYDIGFTHPDEMIIIIDGVDFDLYFFQNETLLETVQAFRNLQGVGYAPPKWAFGNQQSRWSYDTRNKILEVADNMRKKWLPCDAIYLDIDYMEGYKNFTIDSTRFPDFEDMVKEMRTKGFRLIPIIDAGVKIEPGYEVYEEGIEKEYFCTNIKGEPYKAAVWPGWVHFPDFQKPQVRKWFGEKYKNLVDFGIEGFWNDMNEPSIFYTCEGLKKFIEKAKECERKNLDLKDYFELETLFETLSGSKEDYESMYQMLEGHRTSHHKIHNLYGFNMTRAAAEGLQDIGSNKRFLLFSRSSFTGMGRYAGLWTGDNHSWWEHILLMIYMMPSLNMGGFLYIGSDIGGFGGDASAALLIRWSQASLLTPLFRNHSALGTRNQEPYAFDDKTTDTMRKVLELRYALIPYIYSEYMKAALKKDLYFKLLSFEYDDDHSKEVEDQLLVGDSAMMAPVYRENDRGRYIWVPEEMLLWKTVMNHQDEFQVIRPGHHYMHLELEETALFIRKNKMIVLSEPAQNVDLMNFSYLTVLAFVDHYAEYHYYDDDGISMEYKDNEQQGMIFRIHQHENAYKISVDQKGNMDVKIINFMITNMQGEFTEIVYQVSDGSLQSKQPE